MKVRHKKNVFLNKNIDKNLIIYSPYNALACYKYLLFIISSHIMSRLFKLEISLALIILTLNIAEQNKQTAMASGYKTLVHSAEQIVQVVSNGERYIRGNTDQMKNISILNSRPADNLTIVSIK